MELRTAEELLLADEPYELHSKKLRRSFGPALDVEVLRIGDFFVFQGDMVLNGRLETSPNNASAASLAHHGMVHISATVSDENFLWPSRTVPLYIDPQTDPVIRENIKVAVSHWREVTGLSFVDKEPSHTDWIEFVSVGGCGSDVGRRGGRQHVFTDGFCSAGRIMHELGHSIGLFHEQSRSDRDQFVKINWDNIARKNWIQFDIATDGDDVGSYDFDSIMHYTENAFAIDRNQPTILPLGPLPEGTILGQRNNLSKGDIAAVRRLYFDE